MRCKSRLFVNVARVTCTVVVALSAVGFSGSDFNSDGQTDLEDFAFLAQCWLKCNQADDPVCVEPVAVADDFDDPGGVIRIRVQAPEIMSGPNNSSDMWHFGLKIGDVLSSYTANSYTDNHRGPTLESSIVQSDEYFDGNAAITPGAPGSFDDKGAWLIHAIADPVDPNFVRGWYHAEQYTSGNYRKTLAYAESTDGGVTFQKVCAEDPSLNYPNNQWLTAWTGYDGQLDIDDNGDAHIIEVGDYYYAFFLNTEDWKFHVARSAVADKGLPGTWWKYYVPPGTAWNQGDFTEPGIGGKSTCSFNPNSNYLWQNQINWNSAMGQYMNFPEGYSTNPGWSGVYLAFSDDPVSGWLSAQNYPLFPYEGTWSTRPSWDRGAVANELHGYRSMCPLNSVSQDDRYNDQFWFLVDAYLNPDEGFAERYSLRRKVSLTRTWSTNVEDRYTQVELGLYRNDQNDDEWATTYCTFGHYRKLETVGYMVSAKSFGCVPLYGLYNASSDDHLVSTNSSEAHKLRLLGYIFSSYQPSGTIPLYRTYDSASANHSVTTDGSHPDVELLLGYIFPPVGDETFAFQYNSIDQTERLDGVTSLSLHGQQGYFNWYYQERRSNGNLVDMQYDPASGWVWNPEDTQVWSSTVGSDAMLTPYGGHPGSNSRAVRIWSAIDDGYAYITAKAWDKEPGAGDGVDVMILKNGQVLWSQTLTTADKKFVSFGVNVERSDAISFEIDPRNNNTSDRTYFCPKIRFQWHNRCDLDKNNYIGMGDLAEFVTQWLL